ncbi:MAG: TlpA disulfide reductase family protein [candidate division NC10 bacterium]|jgi:cytochrome c biogenesis protein CcmG/thiol:disulfide interchange protein DsbE
MKKVLIPLSVLPILFLLAYGFWTDPRYVPSPLIAKPAPPFALTLFDGEHLSLKGLQGKVVVVNFWASWCFPACYEEAPVLEGTWRTYKDKDVVVVGVNVQDTENAAKEFMDRFQFTFPNGPDPGGKISIDYGVYGIPETFVLDKEGRIAYKHVGAVTADVLSAQIEGLLRRAPRAGDEEREGHDREA